MPCALDGVHGIFLIVECIYLKRRIMMSEDYTKDLSLLGNQEVKYGFDYNHGVLETFENKHQVRDYFVKFNCPEFTTLCPITNQPDLQRFTSVTYRISKWWRAKL